MILLLACTPDSPAPVPDETTPETIEEDPGILSIEAELSTAIVTVVRVRWTTAEAELGYVEFGEDTAYGHSTTTVEGTEHEVLLLGMPADTDVHFRVATVRDGEELWSDDQMITTGPLPPGLPNLTTTGEVTSWVGGYQVLPVQGVAYAVIIIDDQGRIVWYTEQDPAFLIRALVTADRQSVIFFRAGEMSSVLTRVSMDGETVDEVPFIPVDHDFTELPDGTLAGMQVYPAPGAEDLNLASIMEVATDGTLTEVWRASDDAALSPWLDEGYQLSGNAMDYHDGAYYVSLMDLGTIVKVDRATGQSVWHLNGLASDFVSDGETIAFSHQFHVLDGGLLLFDNGEADRGYSRAVEFAVDEDAMTVEEVWSYRHDPDVYGYVIGDVARFDDGGTQVVWSTSGQIQNVTPEGDVVWQLDADLGSVITYVQVLAGLYE